MTVSINDLTKLGVINDITTDKMKENHTKCYEVINPHNPVDQVKFYLYDRSHKDLTKMSTKDQYILRTWCRCINYGWHGGTEGLIIVKKFDSYKEMVDYSVCKFLYHFLTQNDNGSANTHTLFTKKKYEKFKQLTYDSLKDIYKKRETLRHLMKLYQNSDKAKSVIDLFLKDFN